MLKELLNIYDFHLLSVKTYFILFFSDSVKANEEQNINEIFTSTVSSRQT